MRYQPRFSGHINQGYSNLKLLNLADKLCAELSVLTFDPPVTHVYNPLEYARAPYASYLRKYGRGKREVLFVGMNPGPWGMAQTGVPFGEVQLVRDWLKIEARVDAPTRMHPARRVQGFACARREISGQRLWGWARDRFGTPEEFFARFFVVNYCPLLFLAATSEKTATNVTPDKLPKEEREPLLAACDRHLAGVIDLMAPRFVIGIGGFAEGCVIRVAEQRSLQTGCILHPSPASPAANRGWVATIERQLRELGIALP